MTQEMLALAAAADKDSGKGYLGRGVLSLNAEITAFGIRPVYETDFHAHRNAATAYSDRGQVTGVFDPGQCQIGPQNGFWIRGVDDNGQTVHAQAMRYDDLGDTTLASHWLQNSGLFAPAGLNIDIGKSTLTTAPASHEICGGVCYHGDFWVAKGGRKFGLAPLLSQLAMLIALVRFSPDFIYGLILPRNIRKGWAAQQGYLHTYPWALSWHVIGQSKPYDDCLAWVTGRELDGLWRAGKRHRNVAHGRRQADQRRRPVMQDAAGQ